MVQFNNAFTLFLSLLVEAIPFLLIGVAFSSILLFFISEQKLIKILPKNALLGALAGSLIGVFFPVCECGNVPVARRLITQGAPASVAIGFLLAAPTINPVVFWATWVAFRDQPEMVFLRIGCTLLIATIIGWVFSRQKDLRPLLQPNVARSMLLPAKSADQDISPLLRSGTFIMQPAGQVLQLDAPSAQSLVVEANTGKSVVEKIKLVIDNMIQELRELGAVLILGSAVAATIQVLMPRELILSLGQDVVSSVAAMMLLAAVVSICSTVDAFFALSFASTFTGGSLLAFLVFGPMIDLKNLGLMMTVFKGRAVIYMFVLAAQLCFVLSLLVNLYVS
jgi:uncharacterized protein